jgi:hypothetical protein
MRKSNYEKFPAIKVPNSAGASATGWPDIADHLRRALEDRAAGRTVLVVECYPGVDETAVRDELSRRLTPALTVTASEALLPPEKVDALVAPFLGGNDPVFGFLADLNLPQFFDEGKLAVLQSRVATVATGLVLIVGCGARLIALGDLLVYADLARWEAQGRFRRNVSSNLGVANQTLAASLQYKRAFFVDWRVADRWKRPLIARWDFVLDTNDPAEPKLAVGAAVRRGLSHAVTRPFRVVPFFDPGALGRPVDEGDLRSRSGGEKLRLVLRLRPRGEQPACSTWWHACGNAFHQLVFASRATARRHGPCAIRLRVPHPVRLLRYVGGGNLSLQVHPLTGIYSRPFRHALYTQDESYYMLEAEPDATVYLGLKDGVDRRR